MTSFEKAALVNRIQGCLAIVGILFALFYRPIHWLSVAIATLALLDSIVHERQRRRGIQ